MCLKPIYIRKPVDSRPSFLKVYQRNAEGFRSKHFYQYTFPKIDPFKAYNDSEFSKFMNPYRYSRMLVPCGKCFECLKAKQNDLAVRCYIEAKKKGSMHFVTLTYKDVYLPFSKRLYLVDVNTGDMIPDSVAEPISRVFFENHPDVHNKILDEFHKYPKQPNPFYLVDNDFDNLLFNDLPFRDSDFIYTYSITPSLNRRDPRLWIKRCRVKYERKFAEKLPDFTYILVGEMGVKTSRPHYHIGFFGLKKKHIDWMCSEWTLGFTYAEEVKVFNEDGTSGFLAASRYIAKYISKGCFECSSIKQKDCEKPRYCTSVNFGVDLNNNLINFYRCYDLFGRYDINTSLYPDIPNNFTLPSLKLLHEEVKKRAKVDINGFKYKLPKNTLKRLFYVKDSKGVYHPSAVQMAFTSFVQSDFLDDFIREFLEVNPYASDSEVSEAVFQKQRNLSFVVEGKEQTMFKTNSDFYNKSVDDLME